MKNLNANYAAPRVEEPKIEMRKIRLLLGGFGLLLPILLYIGNDFKLMPSISHFYYTSSAVFLISMVTSLGIVLIAYKGYEKTEKEWFSDNVITSIAGISAIALILFPAYSDKVIDLVSFYGYPNDNYLFGSMKDATVNNIHFFTSAMFIMMLGVMSYFKFTKAGKYVLIYKSCGIVIGISVVLIALFESVESLKPLLPNYVFWFETIAVYSFAIAFMVKAKPKQTLLGLFSRS
ncbi:hypothetical protein MY04_2179 [Flammeovirga sp. MY04]|uniref:hypothetical protein n=1 Tax=Flammeovirga sp. MY04 TaxID=1191459 RepID=UPI0008061DC0|nr:hypothetical protein [Flammeovirga sp. MY04]ANQ49553.1 hypothetical protein MY04_2179 [Flammeovirga sp. MY04]